MVLKCVLVAMVRVSACVNCEVITQWSHKGLGKITGGVNVGFSKFKIPYGWWVFCVLFMRISVIESPSVMLKIQQLYWCKLWVCVYWMARLQCILCLISDKKIQSMFHSQFFAFFYQYNLEGQRQPFLTKLHRWAAPQLLIAPRPPGGHRHTDQCLLHHLHLRGHVGERAGLGILQGSPVSAHITHCFQKTAWADAQRCNTSPHGSAQHYEDR